MASFSKRSASALFKKNDDALPFFSIHPKTNIGAILRILFCAFMVLAIVITLVANSTGITPAKYWDWFLLVYLVPALIVLALIVVALFKRLKTPAGRILVGILAGFVLMLAISLTSTMMALSPLMNVASVGTSAPSPDIRLRFDNGEYKQNIVLMRMYAIPDEYITGENKDASGESERLYPLKHSAYLFSAVGADGEACRAEGEILVRADAKYEIKLDWPDENTARFYPEAEPAGAAEGEIVIRFAGEGVAAADADGKFVRTFTNSLGTHSVSLYQKDSYTVEYVSVYNLSQDALKRIYIAYPSIGFQLLKMKTRVEGQITVEPYGSLEPINIQDMGNRVLRIFPGEGSYGASGEIMIYLDEQVELNRAKADGAEQNETDEV